MKIKRSLITLAACLVLTGYRTASGHADAVGHSGAPGSLGACASACHGNPGGTIIVSGFPTSYTPGQAYLIQVNHSGGDRISNFNASVRNEAGIAIVGSLAAGLNTGVYDASPDEPQGVHFTRPNLDSGNFTWTAPAPGAGTVKLYLAGMQGTVQAGPNTEIVVTATESNAIDEQGSGREPPMLTVENRIVTGSLLLRVGRTRSGEAVVRIVDHSGRTIGRIPVSGPAGDQTISWQPKDSQGHRLAPGSYYAVLVAGGRRWARKFVIAGQP